MATDQLEREIKQLRESFASFTEALLKLIGTKPVDQRPRIQAGLVPLNGNPNSFQTDVSFPRPFASVPVVILTPTAGTAGSNLGLALQVLRVNENGFSCVHPSVQHNQVQANWIAMVPEA